MRFLVSSLVAFSFGLAACGPADAPIDQEEAFVADDSGSYVIVTRGDYRKCLWPMCGGWFVKRVNQKKLRCADGQMAAECHVASLDVHALGLSSDQAAALEEQFGASQALVRGTLGIASGEYGDADTLFASEAWAGQAHTVPSGSFYEVQLNGVKCFTWPCPSYDERKLNSSQHGSLAGVDLAASGASEAALEAGYASVVEGLLVAGKHQKVTGPGGKMNELVASEFYLRVQPGQSEGQFCGGIAGLLCPEGQICDIDIANACGGADLSGTCRTAPDACIELYQPVCGCDGKTYGNDCDRLMAGAQLDHEGECGSVAQEAE